MAAACSEPTAGPQGLLTPSFHEVGAVECEEEADFVVTEEASLLAALAAASPGDVIALDGFFGVTADVLIFTEDLTITCATPGSGLFAEPGAVVFDILNPLARRVRVDRLVLDASGTIGGPYFTFNDGVDFFAEDVRFTNNTVTCGPVDCVFLAGTAGARVEGNHFEYAGSVTGVQLQGGIDGSRVKGNTIIATAPSLFPTFGGIRVRDGSDVEVEDNVVIGPWANSVAAANLLESEVESNRLEGAAIFGIATSTNTVLLTRDNEFEDNSIIGAGAAAVFVSLACGNEFEGNELQVNTLVIFDDRSEYVRGNPKRRGLRRL